MEESYKHEKKTKEAVQRVFRLCSFHSLKDTLDASEDETDENRLLPAMNKIWPFLVACLRNKNPLVSDFLRLFVCSLNQHGPSLIQESPLESF